MATLTCDFFSEALEVGTSVSVVLPQPTRAQIGVSSSGPLGPPPVLYLLHGLSDDHTAWTRYTSIERYAAAAGLAVVMPAVGRSFYADERHGHPYWTYVSEELPEVVRTFFRVSDRPEDTFVAGLSMGGYGAMRLALTHPERYAAAASLSGALDLAELVRKPERRELFARVFDGHPAPEEDLLELLGRRRGERLPALHVSCGTGDALLDGTQRFAAAALEAGADVTTDYRPGDHEWGLWDAVVRDVIDWLPRRTSPA
ncbi:alpha/beta hydrolase [Nocardioides panaciterrulae]|uniref:S-formylglutathione hydrolase FrmB n=1 Tax=Nocardioides panaciterrulae TaxID=661492 RepID=A0A7Y9E887_9ACTN|nr:alpha/beta hydrolase family protein [Nocardioides panaciterrulae]NYD42710.1 S-formylglutathione hydrolase FrmB [Nocardioides panaciterrulae]